MFADRQTLDGPRVEGKEGPEPALADRQPLEPGGAYGAGGEAALGPGARVEARVDRRLGPALGDRREHPFRAPHDQQVVVHEAD